MSYKFLSLISHLGELLSTGYCNDYDSLAFVMLTVNKTRVPVADAWLVKHVVVHEMGHVFGMDHEGGFGYCQSVMCNGYRFVNDRFTACSDVLTDRDVGHVNSIWP